MAIARGMSREEDKDDHEQDVVMPGFRFHPTEEELVEFYLRRKVEGKRFNVELITFLDLYRYDPWELPAMATIGEKEWFFYVPRDRKYRNGDRPNRVTTSGYWKATGADRMIRTESFKSIGLKKTLVFYYGKAPKGIRTSWIMNEYRLPQHETDRYQKAEISLCRVYKRPGVEEHASLPASVSSKPSSSSRRAGNERSSTSTAGPTQGSTMEMEMLHSVGTSSSSEGATAGSSMLAAAPKSTTGAGSAFGTIPAAMLQEEAAGETLVIHKPMNAVDELHKIVDFQQLYQVQHHPGVVAAAAAQYFPLPSTHEAGDHDHETLPLHLLPSQAVQSVQASLWQWNTIPEANKDFANFK